jgi:hypothetical protein
MNVKCHWAVMNVELLDIPVQERRFQFTTEYQAGVACQNLNISGCGTYIVVPVYECGGRIYLDKSKMEQEA